MSPPFLIDRNASCPVMRRRRCIDVAASRAIEAAALALHAPHELMQRAGLGVARLALALAPHARSVWVACGPGNNGGDGLVAATHLHRAGLEVVATLFGDAQRLPDDARQALADAQQAGVRLSTQAPAEQADLVIDALLGLGASRAPQGPVADAIVAINARPRTVLAVDLPSGLHADTGAASGRRRRCVADAHAVVADAEAGAVHRAGPRPRRAGLARRACACRARDALPVRSCAALTALRALRPRAHASHKGSHGDVAVVGGAPGMSGRCAAGRARGAGQRRRAGIRQSARCPPSWPAMRSSPS